MAFAGVYATSFGHRPCAPVITAPQRNSANRRPPPSRTPILEEIDRRPVAAFHEEAEPFQRPGVQRAGPDSPHLKRRCFAWLRPAHFTPSHPAASARYASALSDLDGVRRPFFISVLTRRRLPNPLRKSRRRRVCYLRCRCVAATKPAARGLRRSRPVRAIDIAVLRDRDQTQIQTRLLVRETRHALLEHAGQPPKGHRQRSILETRSA
jgi:hypothetical protein